MNENSINGYLAVVIWSGLKSLLCVWKHVLGHTVSKTQYKRKSGIFSGLIFYTMYTLTWYKRTVMWHLRYQLIQARDTFCNSETIDDVFTNDLLISNTKKISLLQLPPHFVRC